MSFYSGLVLTRMGDPPAVTGADVGKFLLKLLDTEVVKNNESYGYSIKYGKRIDDDMKSTSVMDWDTSGMIGTPRDYPWDRTRRYGTLRDLADSLKEDYRTIYRAEFSLGDAVESICDLLKREPCEDNIRGYYPQSMSFRLEPILISHLSSEEQVCAGWMGFDISGDGQYFPRSYREQRILAESSPLLEKVVAVCRETWPASGERPTESAIQVRRELGELWLYDDFTLPTDWRWFAYGT